MIVEGGATNKSFLTALLEAPEVVEATADTGWVDRARAEGRLIGPPACSASRWRPRR